MRLVYIIGTYPEVTTTFIDREIQILKQWGAQIKIISIRRPPESMPFSRDQQTLQEEVTYLFPIHWLQFALALLYFSLRHPRSCFGALAYLAARPHPTLKARIKTVLHFLEGIYTASLLRKDDFHEFHAHFVDRAATVAFVAGKLLDKPYSLSIHTGADVFVDPILLTEKIAHARHAVTCTEFNKAHLEAITGTDLSHRVTCINHGLNLEQYSPPFRRSRSVPLILSVAQLAPRKGLLDLVRACRSLKDLGAEFQCEIIGQGPQRRELESTIRELGLEESVHLCGALPHDEVIARYSQATMFVLPCIQARDGDIDGIPNVLIEAMAMHVPVISTQLGAVPELVEDGFNGLLAPPGDPEALALAMVRLLDDPVLSADISRNGRQTVLDSYNIESNLRKFTATLWPAMFPSQPASPLSLSRNR